MSVPHRNRQTGAYSINNRKWFTLALVAAALFACVIEFGPRESQAKNPGGQTAGSRVETPAPGVQAPLAAAPNTAKESDELWNDVAASAPRASSAAGDNPKSSRSLELNRPALERGLAEAPMEFTDEARQKSVVVSLPLPDGRLWRFRIQESPIVSEEMAAKFPEIKTYAGQGVDEPGASVRFSWSPEGLNAFVLSDKGAFVVAPAAKNDARYYLSYRAGDVEMKNFECLAAEAAGAKSDAELPPGSALSLTGATLRTYRLVINVTPQLFFASGNTNAATNSTIVTLLNGVNAIYQREAAIRFTLVGWALDTQGFLPPESAGADQLALGSQAMSNFISPQAADYDVGHALGIANTQTGFGAFDAVCNNSFPLIKATAATILAGALTKDTLVFSHELGHQLGARHTFTPVAGACAGAADPLSKYEPWSGSTIMSYTGVCFPEDLQPASDPYFHVDSLLKIEHHIATFPPCAAQTPTGNSPPIIHGAVGVNATIPARTPFTLTGNASDPNGEAVLYNWEQFDLNAALFRSYPPTLNPSRTFPHPFYILEHGNTPPFALGGFLTGEAMPTTTRTLTFQLTVRDLRPSGGGATSGFLQVFVRGEAGPFAVTQPNTPVTWTGASQRVITWNVANTNLAPVSTTSVRILLSTDGGATFPTVLAASTPNDGSETVTLPNVQTSTARVKIEAVGNIYFDISNTNFVINQGSAPTSNRKTVGVFRPSNGIVYLKNSNAGGFADIDLVYGIAGDQPVAGDWDGNGTDTVGIYRNGVFFLRNSNTTGPANIVFSFGAPGDQPVAGDWNGDGVTTIGVYRPSTGVFFLRNSNTAGGADLTFVLGNPGDVAIAGDWNGDGITTTGVFRPTNGIVYLKNTNVSGDADIGLVYGNAGDKPLAGDWNGDGIDSVGIYRNGLFFLRNSNTQGVADLVFALGNNGDVPIAGDWDGLP